MTQEYTAESVTADGEQHRTGSRVRTLIDRWRHDPGIWRRGIVLAILAVLVTLLMIFHAQLPNTIGNLGSLTETFLPWFGLFVPLIFLLALVRRSAVALIVVLLPAVVWVNLFGGLFTDKTDPARHAGELTVVTHNVNADNPDPKGTAGKMVASGADVVALEELTAKAVPVYEAAMKGTYKYHSVQGTVGLWSKYPLSGTKPVDIKLGWVRAMRSTVTTAHGEVAVYVAHLPSVRVKLHAGFTANQRDKSADALGEAIADEQLPQVVLLGDLNGTMNDRALEGVTAQMRSTQGAAGHGNGFSWPAAFPLARIDQIMVKGVEPTSSWTLPRTDSDHLPIAARVELR
nr:endonuclease/exonuclease/phosphatase family protein [Streptomyces sp. NBC_00857]